MANPANAPWIARDTKRVTVMSVENISFVICTKRGGGGGGVVHAATKSGRRFKGITFIFLSHVKSFLYKYIKINEAKKRRYTKGSPSIPDILLKLARRSHKNINWYIKCGTVLFLILHGLTGSLRTIVVMVICASDYCDAL